MKPSLPLDRKTRLTQEDLPPVTVFLDTETYGVQSDHYQRLALGCFELWHTNRFGLPNGNHRTVHRGIFRTVDEFYELLKSWGTCRVIAHNWQFDAAVLRLGARNTRTRHGYYIDPKEGIYPLDRSGFSPFLVTLRWKGSVTKAEFICNTNFHKTSLAKLGESFGMEKLEMPLINQTILNIPIPRMLERFIRNNDSDCIQETGMDPDLDHFLKLIKYCKRDVEILRKSWFELFKFSKEEAGITPGITVASMGMRMYTKRWLPSLPKGTKILGNRTIEVVGDAEREAYHGGRTEVFWQGKASGTLRKYDANSMYPSSMLGAIPIQWDGIGNADGLARALETDGMGQKAVRMHLAQVTVQVPSDGIGWLGWDGINSEDAGYIFPSGTFRGWFWQPMLAMAHREGWIQDVHNVLTYKAWPIFRRYVLDVYNLRLEATRQGNKPRRLLYKYLLNSVYGKTGQGTFGSWDLLKPGSNEYEWQHKAAKGRENCRWSDYVDGSMDSGKASYWETEEGIYRWSEPEEGMGRKSVCSIAGYITSLARATLLEVMQGLILNGSRVFMCDTDSVITDGRLPASLCTDGLGGWKLEEEADGETCDFMAPKHYTFDNVTKCKGVRKPEPGVSTYTQAQFSKWQTDFMSGNPARNGRLEHGAMVTDVTKTVTGQNKKRRTDGNGPTYPLVL